MKPRTLHLATTAVIVVVMIFSIYKMYSPAYARLGFPTYFRGELAIAKTLGILVLVAPGLPLRIKEAAHVGFAIVLISAMVAHLATGDSLARSAEPLGFLAVLAASSASLRALRGSRDAAG